MNLGASAVVLRPRSLGEVLDLACRLCVTRAFGLYARLSLAILAPVLAACLSLRYAAGLDWIATWIVAVAGGALAQGVFTVAASRLLFSEELTVGQVLRLFGRRLSSYLAMIVLSRLVLAVACVPAFIGLPFAWTRLFFVHEACLLETASPAEGLRRSNRFVAMQGASVFGALVSLLLAQGGFVLVAELLGQGVLSDVLQLGKPFGALFTDGGSPFALVGLLLSVPFVATARFLDYIDERTRADGWDIQLRFLAIAAADRPRSEAA